MYTKIKNKSTYYKNDFLHLYKMNKLSLKTWSVLYFCLANPINKWDHSISAINCLNLPVIEWETFFFLLRIAYQVVLSLVSRIENCCCFVYKVILSEKKNDIKEWMILQ